MKITIKEVNLSSTEATFLITNVNTVQAYIIGTHFKIHSEYDTDFYCMLCKDKRDKRLKKPYPHTVSYREFGHARCMAHYEQGILSFSLEVSFCKEISLDDWSEMIVRLTSFVEGIKTELSNYSLPTK